MIDRIRHKHIGVACIGDAGSVLVNGGDRTGDTKHGWFMNTIGGSGDGGNAG